jgi:uncharacterized protein YlxP (DUF503 family)
VVVGTLEVHLRIEGSYSLKDKRRVLRSLIDRIRRDFHVSISEVADQDLWNVATVGAACVSNDSSHSQSVLAKVLEVFDACAEVRVEGARTDMLRT